MLQTPGFAVSLTSVNFSATSAAVAASITITADGVTGIPQATDWLAIYGPPTANISNVAPVRYQLANWSGLWSNGAATYSFTLPNLHDGGFVAYLIRGGISLATPITVRNASAPGYTGETGVLGGPKPFVGLPGPSFMGQVLAVSAPIEFASLNVPTHVRVTLGASLQQPRISWNMAASSTGGYVLFSLVAGGAATGTRVDAVSWRMTVEDLCSGGPATSFGWRAMGTQWTAAVNLTAAAGSTVYYTVGDVTDRSTEFTLTVPPPPGAPEVKFLAWSDQSVGFSDDSFAGRNYNAGKYSLGIAAGAAADTASWGAAFMVHSGDTDYSDGYFSMREDYMEMQLRHERPC